MSHCGASWSLLASAASNDTTAGSGQQRARNSSQRLSTARNGSQRLATARNGAQRLATALNGFRRGSERLSKPTLMLTALHNHRHSLQLVASGELFNTAPGVGFTGAVFNTAVLSFRRIVVRSYHHVMFIVTKVSIALALAFVRRGWVPGVASAGCSWAGARPASGGLDETV